MKNLEKAAVWVDEALRELGDPKRRDVTSGYFPTSLEILGVSVPKTRKVLQPLHREFKGQDPAAILELARLLVDMGTHEGRQVGFELLDKRKDARALMGLKEVHAFGIGNDNWASVDTFGVFVTGPIWREGQITNEQVMDWTNSENRWWRRTALVSTVALNMPSRGGRGDVERTVMVCDALADDGEPMVAKALSWALRTLIRVEKEPVEGFLERHEDVLAALVRREVRTKLDTGRKMKPR